MMRRLFLRSSALQALAFAALLLASCASPLAGPADPSPRPATATQVPTTAAQPASPVPSPLPTQTSEATETAAALPEPAAAPTTGVSVVSSICSPLEGISLEELSSPDLLKQPFLPPRPGYDDGHHGVDFAYWSRGERRTMLDHPVRAILDGTVAAVLDNRIPYGYTVIIETPLDQLPPAWLEQAAVPTLAPTHVPSGSLYCPAPEEGESPPSAARSLYLLYAHFSQPSPLSVGETVSCGQNIGLVGTTGNSVNYHLHLETRIGPAGVTFPEMTHYDNRATQSEMRAYCAWRVSGLFQMFDPMEILSLQP
jgi:murein DD-endopeptidase MepM/ murein hydrolase activator NlpD